MQIKFIEYTLTDEYKNFPKWMTFSKIYLRFDNKMLDIIGNSEKQALNQLLDFFNGIKTLKEELLTINNIFKKSVKYRF